MESLSSPWTFFYEFVLFPGWTVGLGVASCAKMRSGPAANPDQSLLQLLVAWLVGTFVLWLICGRLKKVALEGDQLVVSNYRDTIWIPVHAIGAVKQNLFTSIRPVRIVLTEQTQFGRSILFLPRPPHGLFSESEIVGRLRRLARLQGGA